MAYGSKGGAIGSFVQGLNSGVQAANSMYKNYTDTEDRVKARRARIIAGEEDQRFQDDTWTTGPDQYSGGILGGGAIPQPGQPPQAGGQQGATQPGPMGDGTRGALPTELPNPMAGSRGSREPEMLFSTVTDFGNKMETAKAGGDPSKPQVSLSVPRAKDWAMYKKTVYDRILERTGRQDLAEEYMDDIERRQDEGFAMGASKARTYLAGGNLERAASELQKAYGFIDDGWGMVIAPADDGKGLMVYRASEDGKLVDPDSGTRVDDRMLAKMAEIRRTPALADKRSLDEYQENTQTLAQSQQLQAKWSTLSAKDKNDLILEAEDNMWTTTWPTIKAQLDYSDNISPAMEQDILASAIKWYRANLEAGNTPTPQQAVMQALEQTDYSQ